MPPCSRLLRLLLIVVPVMISACADFDLFEEKKTPLAGDRKPLFPTGVPGVNYSEPPLQPTNSNIPVNTQISGLKGSDNQAAQENEQPAAKGKARNARTAKNQPQRQAPDNAPADDPWSDSRTTN